MGRPAEVAVKFSVPFVGEISGTWRPDDAERKAAWELYVELITRVSVVELGPSEGVLREALSSQYTLFHTTRDILRRYGPDVAPRSRQGEITFGSLAVTVLNAVVRPLLTRWHPALAEHEAARPPGVAPQQHEQAWEHEAELRQQLSLARHTLTNLARVLAEVAGAADLLPPTPPRIPNQAGGGGLRKRRCRLTHERHSHVGSGRRSPVVADSHLRPSFRTPPRPRAGTCGAGTHSPGTCGGSLV
ncbi:hypothetical protein RM550_36195 [Streptomyces sp. DSM 41527]|uniref:Uncharacterized protein n=1 Tax=Streptomyces mooreae TaxID=3075523 RepID=A0ABU2TJG1_9ACTN|nr:hypothetical protein [Streptomyces sp. DSM 41527]MDT0461088.1 hypothetical protein [Streptomyces sp. DSM 41527]